MSNYNKWDAIDDSDEEREKAREEVVRAHRDDQEHFKGEQEKLYSWLRRQEIQMQRHDQQAATRQPRPRPLRPHPVQGTGFSGSMLPGLGGLPGFGGGGLPGFGGGAGGTAGMGGDADEDYDTFGSKPGAPWRRVTNEERKVLAMFIAINHFEEGATNLDRHPQILEFTRHHRWLEEDPETLELLCRAHNTSMKLTGGSSGSDANGAKPPPESREDARMRAMCLSGINTLAAPKRAKCAGGLLELVTLICTPQSDAAADLRVKWQKKEFGKDAVFESLFPDMKRSSGPDEAGWTELLMFAGLLILMVIVVVAVMWYLPLMSDAHKKAAKNATAAASSAIAGAASGAAAPSAAAGLVASAAGGAALAAGAGAATLVGAAPDAAAAALESQRKIEELQRQIEELKRSQAAAASAAGGGGAGGASPPPRGEL